MPLLEVGQGRSNITDRFDFLKLDGDASLEHDKPVESEPKLFIQPASAAGQNIDLYVEKEDLQPVFVLKTSLKDGRKLFVNVTSLASPAHPLIKLFLPSQPNYTPEVWLSAVSPATDKKGDTCEVITALPLLLLAQGYNDQDLKNILQAIENYGIPVSNVEKWSIPKMKRKDALARIRIPQQPPQAGKNFVGKPLIAEIQQPEAEHSSPAFFQAPSVLRPLSTSTLATPLPTQYTHEFTRELSAKQSWSVYFDANDGTLKVLIPPSEEFMSLPVQSDDFRAFTRDSKLHVFCIGK